MKIKKTRQVRLDELLKYVWDNGIKCKTFKSDRDKAIYATDRGNINCGDQVLMISPDERFTITEEVEIDEETPINLVYRIKTEKGWQTFDKNETPINRIINTYKRHSHAYLGFIYLQNDDGSIGELIWSKERGLID